MFAANNLKSGNFGSIIRVFLSKSAEVLVAAELDELVLKFHIYQFYFTHNSKYTLWFSM